MNITQRNNQMREDRQRGDSVTDLAERYSVSKSQVYRITKQPEEPLEQDQLFREFGSSGLSRFSGLTSTILEDGLREMRSLNNRIATYTEMELNSPVVQAVLFAMTTVMREVSFFVESVSDSPEDRAAAEFLEECMDDMSFSWDDTLSMALTFWQYGFSPLELVYKSRMGRNPGEDDHGNQLPQSKFDDGRVGWRKWSPRPADTLAPGNEWMFDAHGGIQGLRQQASPDWRIIEIPIEKLVLFRTTVAPKNSPEGRSLLRSMYAPWYYATNLQEIEAIGAERDLAGLPIIYLGQGTVLEGANSDFELGKDIVRNIRRDEQEGIVIPYPKMSENNEGRGMLLELLSSGGSRQFDVDPIISRYEKRMAMSVLAQWVFLGMERIGTQALATVHGDFFTLSLDGWANNITETINRHAVPRLFDLNTFNVDETPRWRHSRVGSPDLAVISSYVNSLVGAEVLTPDEDLERHLRQIARFPVQEMEEVEPLEDGGDEDQGPLVESNVDLADDRVRDMTILLQRQTNTARRLLESGQIDQATADEMIEPILDALRDEGIIGKQFVIKQKPSEEESNRLADSGASDLKKVLRERYGEWLEETAKELDGERDPIRRQEIIEAALLVLLGMVKSLTRRDLQALAVDLSVNDIELAAMESVIEDSLTVFENKTVPELGDKLSATDQELDVSEFVESNQGRWSRIALVAGVLWTAWQASKFAAREDDPLVRWTGAADEESCQPCLDELHAGVRPLSQTPLPGPGVCEGFGNCRHEIKEVTV